MANKDPQAFFGGGASQSGGMPGAAMGEPGTQGTAQIATPDPVSSGSGGVGAGKSYDVENMIRTYLPGLVNDPVKYAAVRDALKGSESGSGVGYHQAITALIAAHPELQQYSKWGQAFPATSPGQLTDTQSKALWAAADAYEKPYMDAMQNTAGQMGAYLKQLMPSLPKGYQSLVKAQMEGPGGLLNLPSQVSNLIHQENPAAIANAYAQYYGSGGTTPAATGLNLASLVPPKTST